LPSKILTAADFAVRAFAASGVFVGIAPRHGVPISPKTSPKAGEPGTASEATRNALAGAGQ
jgi:hypothetical protein